MSELLCEQVCDPVVQQGCVRRIAETAIYFSGLDTEIVPEVGSQQFESREYQVEAWDAISNARDNGESTALIHLATGLGKTTVAVVDALRFIQEFNGEPNDGCEDYKMPRILFAVHQNEILDQAAERFAHFAPNISQGRLSEGEDGINEPIVFATMQSLH